jgi:aryl-alcohol dehydrogenase-like predicted oxidoreductase
MQRLLRDDVLGPISELDDFARQRGHSLAELAVAWLLAQPTVCSVITGVTRPEQVDQNARAFNIALDAADLAEIDLTVGQMPADLEM